MSNEIPVTSGANKLRSIGQAILEYSITENGSFPSNGKVDPNNPSWGANSLAILMKHPEQFLTDKDLFIVESSGDNNDNINLNDRYPFDNTISRKQCSYGYDSRHDSSSPGDVAIVAHKLILSDKDLPNNPAKQNSKYYGENRPGQNVLFKSGAVKWKTTPLCGYNDDHIYTRDINNPNSTLEEGDTDSWIIP